MFVQLADVGGDNSVTMQLGRQLAMSVSAISSVIIAHVTSNGARRSLSRRQNPPSRGQPRLAPLPGPPIAASARSGIGLTSAVGSHLEHARVERASGMSEPRGGVRVVFRRWRGRRGKRENRGRVRKGRGRGS